MTPMPALKSAIELVVQPAEGPSVKTKKADPAILTDRLGAAKIKPDLLEQAVSRTHRYRSHTWITPRFSSLLFSSFWCLAAAGMAADVGTKRR
jgi:hypothetical protein